MFENVDGQQTHAGVTGILLAHLRAFGSGELKNEKKDQVDSRELVIFLCILN